MEGNAMRRLMAEIQQRWDSAEMDGFLRKMPIGILGWII